MPEELVASETARTKRERNDPRRDDRFGYRFGKDSFGRVMRFGSVCLLGSQNGGVRFVKNLLGTLDLEKHSDTRGVKIEDADEVESLVSIELLYREGLQDGDFQNFTFSIGANGKPIVVEACRIEKGSVVVEFIQEGETQGSRLRTTKLFYRFPLGGVGVSEIDGIEIYATYLKNGTDRGGELIFFRLEETAEFPTDSLSFEPLPILSSIEQVVERLELDFSWITQEDILNSDGSVNGQIGSIMFTVKGGGRDHLSQVDSNRREQIYGYGRKIELGVDREITDYEEIYLAARDWARVVEVGALGFEIEVPNDYQERRGLYVKTQGEIERELIDLVGERRSWEISQFGGTLEEGATQERFVSGDTMEYRGPTRGECFGRDILVVVKDKMRTGVETVATALYGRDSVVGSIVFKVIAEIKSHELGHTKPDAASGWGWEEVFVQWYSVIFPCKLAKRSIYFNAAYNHDPDRLAREGGGQDEEEKTQATGAFRIESMIDELEEYGVDRDTAIASAMASYKLRALYGHSLLNNIQFLKRYSRFFARRVEFMNRRLLLFGDLYHKHTGKRFETEMLGKTDSDYEALRVKEGGTMIDSLVLDEDERLGEEVERVIVDMVKREIGEENVS